MGAKPQRSALSYFTIPAIAFVLAVIAAAITAGLQTAFVVAILAALEVSLSFDNAVVNAKVLENWPETWRKLFVGLGILVAVFGMRFAFPIGIVAATAHLGPFAAVDLALHHHAQYAARLLSVQTEVSAFGGAFLAMLGIGYFFNAEKDNHWIGPIEALLAKLGQVEAIQAGLTVLGLALTSIFMPSGDRLAYVSAGLFGIVAYVISRAIGTIMSGGKGKLVAASIGGFIYLEMLDASFSFDGVLGAFALTNDIVWIAVALGVGALAVRELTVMAVDRGTLTEYPFLENGAFWSIMLLGIMMLISPVFPMPDFVKGLTGACLILAAFLTSLAANKHALQEAVGVA